MYPPVRSPAFNTDACMSCRSSRTLADHNPINCSNPLITQFLVRILSNPFLDDPLTTPPRLARTSPQSCCCLKGTGQVEQIQQPSMEQDGQTQTLRGHILSPGFKSRRQLWHQNKMRERVSICQQHFHNEMAVSSAATYAGPVPQGWGSTRTRLHQDAENPGRRGQCITTGPRHDASVVLHCHLSIPLAQKRQGQRG